LLLTIALTLFAFGVSANEGDGSYILYDVEDTNVTYGPFWTVDWNSTENITGEIVIGRLDPYHGNEPFTIGVLWPVFNLTEHPNRTVMARVGLDEAKEPQNYTIVMRYEDVYGEPAIQRLWLGRSLVFPQISNTQIVATMDTGEGPISMAYDIAIEPARVVLSASIGTSNGTWENEELTWGTLPVRLVNKGGMGATGLVIDIRYGGRIVSTVDVNLVPASGDHAFDVSIFTVYTKEKVQIYLVDGPLPSGTLGEVNISVVPRPLLDVEGITVTPETIETGKNVRIETMIRNLGNATSTGQLVEIMVDGSIVANTTIDGLGRGNVTIVETKWVMTGEGIHTVSAVVEGDDLAAAPVVVRVKAASPSIGGWAIIASLIIISLVARRLSSDDRA
jgi:hypothetical protein